MSACYLSRGGCARLIFVACFTVFQVGCGLTLQQRAAVERFSAATIDFATLTSSELVRSRTDVLEMNTLRVQLNDDTVKLDRMDAHFTVEQVKVRVDAMHALQEYAELLHTLVTTSQQAQLQNAADSFVTSLRKVQGVSLSDEKAGAIGLAIQQVGGLVVEYMRAKAAREVVTTSHDTILQLVDLVRRDFNPKADHWSLGYDVVVTALVGAAEFAAVGPNAAIRAPLVGEAKVVAAQNRARFTTVAAQVDASAAALREAQINLLSALQSSDVTLDDINNYVVQLQDFVEIYSILRAR
jgi:hypothetical protein